MCFINEEYQGKLFIYKLRRMIESIKIYGANDPLMNKVKHTYKSSFPPEERRKFAEVEKLLTENRLLTIEAFFKDGEYAGFITSWQLDGFIYVEHFAIEENLRNRTIGENVLKHFLAAKQVPVVLEVELPEDEMSRRRIGFYERIGFVLEPRSYGHPPYREGVDGLQLYVMAYGDIDIKKEFERVKECLYQYVY